MACGLPDKRCAAAGGAGAITKELSVTFMWHLTVSSGRSATHPRRACIAQVGRELRFDCVPNQAPALSNFRDPAASATANAETEMHYSRLKTELRRRVDASLVWTSVRSPSAGGGLPSILNSGLTLGLSGLRTGTSGTTTRLGQAGGTVTPSARTATLLLRLALPRTACLLATDCMVADVERWTATREGR